MASDPRTVREVVEGVLGVELPGEDVDLIATGLLDSLSLVTLVVELEQGFDVVLPFSDLDIDDFRDLSSLTRLVKLSREVA